MAKTVKKLSVFVLFVSVLVFSVMALQSSSADMVKPVPMARCNARDFRIEVDTNRNVYHGRSVLRLAVKLLNDSPAPAYVGLCPIKAVPTDLPEGEIEDIFAGNLDGKEVDVAIMPRRPKVIGYATLTRLGPSPVPYHVPYTDQAPEVMPTPIKYRLSLFGSPVVPSHSTRIISTANILIGLPILEAEAEPIPDSSELIEPVDPGQIEIIPCIARHIVVRPGYYLLDCHITNICRNRTAQAQKIIQIRRRILRPVLAEPVPLYPAK